MTSFLVSSVRIYSLYYYAMFCPLNANPPLRILMNPKRPTIVTIAPTAIKMDTLGTNSDSQELVNIATRNAKWITISRAENVLPLIFSSQKMCIIVYAAMKMGPMIIPKNIARIIANQITG